MPNTVPVIAGIDGSPASVGALRWAAMFAARHRCPLWIVQAMPADAAGKEAIPGAAVLESRIILERCREIAAAAAHAASPGIPIQITAKSIGGQPVPVFLRLTARARAVVVGSVGAFRSTPPPGGVGAALARHARCPIVVTPAAGALRWGGPIVAGIDGSDASAGVLEFACAEASARATSVLAVHAWSGARRYPTGEAVVRQASAPWLRRYPDVPIAPLVVRGPPVPWLREIAATAQLLVIGSRHRSGFVSATQGSVSHALLQSLACPLVIAGPPQHAPAAPTGPALAGAIPG